MTEVFGDAFYYIALLNPADRFHGAAVQLTRTLAQRIVTTGWVLAEVADALCAPVVRQRTHLFLERIVADPNTTVVLTFDPWFSRGLSLYGQRGDKSWSLTDCISFEVMSARRIRDALTGDQHFVQAGFGALLPRPMSRSRSPRKNKSTGEGD